MTKIWFYIRSILRWSRGRGSYDLVDVASWQREIIKRVSPFSMGGIERLIATINSVEHIIKNDIPGAFVECGVWRGGHMMAVAMTLQHLQKVRPIYLFDTFEGMTKPDEVDRDYSGAGAMIEYVRRRGRLGESRWCVASLAEVRANILATGYPESEIFFVKGAVEDTLPIGAPDEIALLRLDTDWYGSTLHELCCLYPRVSRLGVVVIDDYGHWQGARRAVDEYISANGIASLLHRIDYSAREFIKT